MVLERSISAPPRLERQHSGGNPYTPSWILHQIVASTTIIPMYKILITLVFVQLLAMFIFYEKSTVVQKYSVNVINVNYKDMSPFMSELNGSFADGKHFHLKTMGELAGDRMVLEKDPHKVHMLNVNKTEKQNLPLNQIRKEHTQLTTDLNKTQMPDMERTSMSVIWNVSEPFAEPTMVNISRNNITITSHSKFVTVAMGMAITTRGLQITVHSNIDREFPFFRSLLATFCKTASKGFVYSFFVAYDVDDPVLMDSNFREHFKLGFQTKTGPKSSCPQGSHYTMKWVQCNYSHSPTWAQNDAMMVAYLDDMDYYYRVNDDTLMDTPGWTELFIYQLSMYSPPHIGVTGPNHEGGLQRILTYDFVHRSHFEIFGFYYPRDFPGWYADRWITEVYLPARSTKLLQVTLSHTLELGTRYEAHHELDKKATLGKRIKRDKQTLVQYIEAVERPRIHGKERHRKVIVSSLDGSFPGSVWGCIRNAQLVHVHFPDWTLRVYVIEDTSSRRAIPNQVRHKLLELGAEVVPVSSGVFDNTTAVEVLKYSVLKGTGNEKYVLFRNSYQRLSRRDAAAVSQWLVSGQPFHGVRDHPDQAMFAINDGLWGGNVTELRKAFSRVLWLSLRNVKMQNSTTGQRRVSSILSNSLWPSTQHHFICHDSVSCDRWPNSVPFFRDQEQTTFIGEHFNNHEETWSKYPLQKLRANRNPKCDSIRPSSYGVSSKKSVSKGIG